MYRMHRLVLFFALLALALFCGCAKKTDAPPVLLPDAAPAEAVAQAPTEAPAPTDAPAPQYVPVIQDDWYRVRCDCIARYMKEYGGKSDAEVQAALARMDLDPQKKMIALTFDDGPNDTYTMPVLNLLEQYDARATFFIQGQNIEGREDILRRMLAIGCEIGNHTWSHAKLPELSIDEARSELERVNSRVKELFDYDVRVMRPPYGSYKCDDDRIKQLAKDMGLTIIMWRRSVHDSAQPAPDADYIYNRAVTLEVDEDGGRLPGGILLFHDKFPNTQEALARILPALIEEGYQIVTVSELLLSSPDGMHAGGVYRTNY